MRVVEPGDDAVAIRVWHAGKSVGACSAIRSWDAHGSPVRHVADQAFIRHAAHAPGVRFANRCEVAAERS